MAKTALPTQGAQFESLVRGLDSTCCNGKNLKATTKTEYGQNKQQKRYRMLAGYKCCGGKKRRGMGGFCVCEAVSNEVVREGFTEKVTSEET